MKFVQATLQAADGTEVHRTRDCPGDTLTVLYGGKTYTRVPEEFGLGLWRHVDIGGSAFRLYVENSNTWDAGGPLSS